MWFTLFFCCFCFLSLHSRTDFLTSKVAALSRHMTFQAQRWLVDSRQSAFKTHSAPSGLTLPGCKQRQTTRIYGYCSGLPDPCFVVFFVCLFRYLVLVMLPSRDWPTILLPSSEIVIKTCPIFEPKSKISNEAALKGKKRWGGTTCQKLCFFIPDGFSPLLIL